MDKTIINIIILIFIVGIINYIVCIYLNKKSKQENFASTEGVATVNEALTSIASLYNNSGTMTIPNLHVTNKLTVDSESVLSGSTTVNNLTASGTTTTNNLTANGTTTTNNLTANGLFTASKGAVLNSSPTSNVIVNTPSVQYNYQNNDGNFVAYQTSYNTPMWSGGIPGGNNFSFNNGITINGSGGTGTYVKLNNLKSNSNSNTGQSYIGFDGNYCVGTSVNPTQFGCDGHGVS